MPNTMTIDPATATATATGGFDPHAFLGRAGAGITVDKYRKNQKIFSQGEPADSLFFIQKGKVKKFGRSIGRRDHVKKAYVSLKAGQELNFSGEGA